MKQTLSQAAGGAKRRHERRLKSAVAVLCDAFEAGAWQDVPGPSNLVIWEADILNLDDVALNALIDARRLQISNVIADPVPLPIAA